MNTYYQNYVVFTRTALTIRSVYDMIISIKGIYTYTREEDTYGAS